ncbi:Gypsy retrotransposon integrase-like protein 1 [Vitis vinifera]|uniref:Gypsy retrotransposon integrase-like protein 1 n=1 Tax=Vitis vinifera TaxID=29760 RepID=A0A438JQQ9_VITVI|nr:Gypsy retrotransposon integrase-like protein 1 [Vitis vinifera]
MREPSPLRNPLGTRGSACVEVMTTLHGSTPSPWRHVEGCVPPEVPPPPPHSQPAPQTIPFTLHSQTKVAPPPAIVPTPISEDPHARMDKLEQKLRQMRTSEGAITWEDFDGAPVASLPAKFRMPEIERYTGIGCPRIHLRLYSTVMRAMDWMMPRWTWDDLAQEFLRQFAFNAVIDVSRRELEALRQRPEESVTSFISRWREKISQIIDRPSERDQISMIMRSLQPRFARHLMGFPHTDFGSLVQALYGIEEGIARGLWSESSPTDSKGKRPSGGQRSGDVGAISSVGMRPSRRYQTVKQLLGTTIHLHLMRITDHPPSRPMTPTYLHPDSQPVFAAHVAERPPAPYTRPRAPQTTTYVQRPPHQFAQLGMPLSRAFQKLTEGGLLIPLASRPLPQPIPPRFRMDLHCSYHQGPGHDTNHCTALRHAIQDLIDQGLVNLGQPSVTTNPLPAHSTHAVHPSSGDIHHMDLIEDDSIHMLSWDDGLPSRLFCTTVMRLMGFHWSLNSCTIQFDPGRGTIPVDSSYTLSYRIGRIAQPPPPTVRPFEGAASHEEVRREDDEVLRQLQSTQDSHFHLEFISIILPRAPSIHHSGCSGRRVPSVLLDNGSALNVCPLATAIALGFAPSDFGPSTQTVMAYDSTKREVMGTLMIDLQIGPATFSTLFQVLRIPTSFNLLLGRPWIHVVELFLLPFIRRTTSAGTEEFIATIDHDTTFGLGFIPTEVDYRHMARLRKERRIRDSTCLEEIDSVVHTDRETELQHLFHQLHCSHDEYRDEMDMMTMSQITSIVQLQPVSAFDMFGVSTIEVFEGTQTLPVPELPEDDSSLFEGVYSSVSCDSISTSAPHSPITQIFDIDDEIAQPSSDRDSFDHHSGPIDERVSPATGDVETIDFGTEDQPRELKIGSPLSTDERDRLIHLLRSYLDVFAWSYEDMPGLDPSIVQHHLPTLPHARPVKQKLRRLHPRWSLQVKEEIQKQLSVGFISVVEYPEWLANVVPVPKKDGNVRILMAPEDMEKIAFITEWGTYCYRVMPFGLKNAGATYQRAATTLFHDMMHRDVEVYVDDMIVKSRGRADHLDALERFFERIRKFRLRLNPKKCTFGVTSGKLLGIWKNQPTVWNDDCQLAFEKIKEYLLSPPVLVPPTPDVHFFYICQFQTWPWDVYEEFVAMTSLSGWCMYFDGAANQSGYGIVEYEACILGLETALELDIRQMEVFGDSNLFLRSGTYPEVATAKDRRALRHLATRFVICGDTLYRRSADGMLLLCLDRASADRVMREVHSGVCGPHMGGHMLARKIMRTGYFWLTMETDCCQFVQKCPECQIHGDLIHAPPSELHALTSPWPFSVWGIDIIGKVSPKSSSGHEFILVAIDYFTKWVEAASYARGAHFRAEVDTLLQEYGIRHHRSSAYRPQTNGAVEAANKNIKRILRKMVETSRDWSEKLPFALWAYRTSFRTSTGATPYSLVYGMEAVLPVETEMGSLRVALEQQISETEWAQARFDQLNLLDERRLRAADHVQAYQRKMARAFKKRVKPRPLQKGDLVLRILRGLIGDPRGKFRPSWSGPYVIRELTPEGAAWLTDLDGNQFSEPTNVDQLKKYYV